jgi:hypothetical protein
MAREKPPGQEPSPSTLEHQQLPPHVEAAGQRAASPEPAGVKLNPVPEGEDRPPSAPTAEAGVVPRYIHQNYRAPAGLRRYKIRCLNYGGMGFRYVLARNQQEAEDCYIEQTGLKAKVSSAKASRIDVAEPWLNTRELPD